MKATIKVKMDNAAFELDNGFELARILRDLADRVEGYEVVHPGNEFALHDTNGNTVGELKVTR